MNRLGMSKVSTERLLLNQIPDRVYYLVWEYPLEGSAECFRVVASSPLQ